MRRLSHRLARVAAAAVLLWLASVVPVVAAEPATVVVSAQQPDVSLGDRLGVRIAVTDARGRPVAGATVALFSPATFGAFSGEMKLGQVTTDAAGEASFAYDARREGAQTLIARFPGNSSHAAAEASLTLSVTGSAQLYQQGAGVKVPGIGVWILALLLSAFWSVYLVVMVLIARIAGEGERALPVSGGSRG